MIRIEDLRVMSNDDIDSLIAAAIGLDTAENSYSTDYSKIMPVFFKNGMSLNQTFGGKYMARMWDGQHDAGFSDIHPIKAICYTFIMCSQERINLQNTAD